MSSPVACTARLRLLQRVYGPSTEQACLAEGLRAGWRVADFGCGIGEVTAWLAQQVGPTGEVVALDASAEQLAVARDHAGKLGLTNISFVEGSAYEPKLPQGTFDLVFCRLLICHLQRPLDALRAMMALLKPGGALVVQELDFPTIYTDPAVAAYDRFREQGVKLGQARGVDFCIGRKLHLLFREVGLGDVRVTIEQPAFIRDERKRLWEYTWLEARRGFIDAGLFTDAEFDRLALELAAAGTDETTLVAQSSLPITRGTRPA